MWRFLTLVALGATLASAQWTGYREISRKALRDKIEGGWAGQMIGVSFGAPTEFKSLGKIIETLPDWKPENVSNSLEQDDLYVDMTLAKVLDDKGLDATSDDFGAALRDAQYPLWHANMAARRALQRGVPGSLSGSPQYNAHADDIDFQIEADFIGLMTPGLMRASNEIAGRAGSVMNYGDGIYGGMFVSCMYAAAYFESDPRKLVETGLGCIPSRSPYAQLIVDLLAWWKENPKEWRKTWALLKDKWDIHDACPMGALTSYNIDAKLNGAFIALGMLYGEGDFGKTIEISTRAGQDSDCNPSSAAGILGVVLGYSKIPGVWKGGIPAIADKKFSHTDFNFRTIVDSTENRTLALIRRTGGSIEGDRIFVKVQAPAAPKLQLWEPGKPIERIDTVDKRWIFSGNWGVSKSARRDGTPRTARTASVKGAIAEVSFEGTGAVVSGPYTNKGGKADIFIDSRHVGTTDVFIPQDQRRDSESVYHIFGLKPGKHTIRLVVRGEPYPGSSGSEITVNDLVVYR
jgi:hypothetical protein